MNGSLIRGEVIRLPERRPLRVALAAADAQALRELRFSLALVRVRSGLLWREVAPDELAAGDVCVRYGEAAPTNPEAHTIELVRDAAATAALFREPRPQLTGVTPAGPRRWTGAVDLPGFAWKLGQPAAGQLSQRDRVDIQPVLDIGQPWLDDVAERLTEALLAAAAPDCELHVLPPHPGGARWGIALSHDVDYVSTPLRYRGTRAYFYARALQRRLGSFGALTAHYARQVAAPQVWRQRVMMAAERDHGVTSEWFVFVRRPGNERGRDAVLYNPRYRIEEPGVRRFLEDLQAQGQRIGLHASPQAGESAELLGDEKATLEAALGHSIVGLRHHLGAARYPESPTRWAAAGFTYDSTLVLNHEHGFRLGTAAPVPLDAAGVPELLELAPNWMDTAAFNCLAQRPERIRTELLTLADAARDRGALEAVVWHDVPMTYANDEDAVYRALLGHALANGGLVASPGRFAEHTRGVLDSRLVEDGEALGFSPGAGLEAGSVRRLAAARTRAFGDLHGAAGEDVPVSPPLPVGGRRAEAS